MSTDVSNTPVIRTAILADGGSFWLLLAAVFSSFVAGLGVLGAVSAMHLEDGGALLFSIAAITVGAIGFRVSLKRHLATGLPTEATESDSTER